MLIIGLSIALFANLAHNVGSYTQGRIAGDLASPIFNSCQAEKQFERKDAHRKPLLPTLRVAEVMASYLSLIQINIIVKDRFIS